MVKRDSRWLSGICTSNILYHVFFSFFFFQHRPLYFVPFILISTTLFELTVQVVVYTAYTAEIHTLLPAISSPIFYRFLCHLLTFYNSFRILDVIRKGQKSLKETFIGLIFLVDESNAVGSYEFQMSFVGVRLKRQDNHKSLVWRLRGKKILPFSFWKRIKLAFED